MTDVKVYAIIDPRDNYVADYAEGLAAARDRAHVLETSPIHPYKSYNVRFRIKAVK